jgi:hypothetical protein
VDAQRSFYVALAKAGWSVSYAAPQNRVEKETLVSKSSLESLVGLERT